MRKKAPIKYCMKCGAKLKAIPTYHSFDLDGGYKTNWWKCVCPNKKWFNFHTVIEINEWGDICQDI